MKSEKIAFVGGGNMTRAIASGLIDHGVRAEQISIADPSDAQRAAIGRDLPGTFVTADNKEAVARANCVVLAVKPQVLASVCKDLRPAVQAQQPLLISIAAGPRISDIDEWLGGNVAVVRVMPNQPALLRAGVSGLFGNAETSDSQLALAKRVMSAVGPVVEVGTENDIDAVTAISGSGPAYFYLLIDMLIETGQALGLNAEDARLLAVETAAGAPELARASDEPMHELIARVRSPGGTTAAALDSLETDNVRDIFRRALTAARDRATELADMAHAAGKES